MKRRSPVFCLLGDERRDVLNGSRKKSCRFCQHFVVMPRLLEGALAADKFDARQVLSPVDLAEKNQANGSGAGDVGAAASGAVKSFDLNHAHFARALGRLA